jgi:hypothetical protein
MPEDAWSEGRRDGGDEDGESPIFCGKQSELYAYRRNGDNQAQTGRNQRTYRQDLSNAHTLYEMGKGGDYFYREGRYDD